MTPAEDVVLLQEGDARLGRLRIEPPLPGQEGSSGIVHMATDPKRGKVLALKRIRGSAGRDPRVLAERMAEAEAQKAIDDPRIASVLDAGASREGSYLLMERLQGRSLDAVLREGPMDPWAAARMARDVALALRVAREHGLVHRDLTPSKVIVRRGGRAALGDLAAGRRGPGDPLPQASLDHLPPEQVPDEPPAPAAHEYALACILFHALTGQPPFAGARPSTQRYWHARAPRPLVSERRSGLPRALDAVVERGMAVDPHRRHGDPVAFAEAAAVAVGTWAEEDDDQPGTPGAPGAAAAGTPRARRRRLAAVAVGGAAALAVAGATMMAGGHERRATARPVATGEVALVRPAGWRSLGRVPAVPGLDGPRVVAIAPPGRGAFAVVAGMADPGRDGLLPDGLLRALAAPPQHHPAVRIGRVTAFRFPALRPKGLDRPVSVYAVPTTAGTATVACLGATGAAPTARCRRVAATLRLTGPRPVPVPPPPGYARELRAALRVLEAARSHGLAAIAKAPDRRRQGIHAIRLSRRYGATAARLRAAPDRRWAAADNAALIAALDVSAKAYAALAATARRRDRAGDAAAREAAAAADRGVQQVIGRLERAGYRLQ